MTIPNLPILLMMVRGRSDCILYPPAGVPDLASLELPDDVRQFYSDAGGAILFNASPFPFELSPPERFERSNQEILRGVSSDDLFRIAPPDDISWFWYVIGCGPNGEYVSIDLHPERLGRCYDSYWDHHANQGDTAIIALSFTELLGRLLTHKGPLFYWLEPGFVSHGDAYDSMPIN